jgi:hypothetical protein
MQAANLTGKGTGRQGKRPERGYYPLRRNRENFRRRVTPGDGGPLLRGGCRMPKSAKGAFASPACGAHPWVRGAARSAAIRGAVGFGEAAPTCRINRQIQSRALVAGQMAGIGTANLLGPLPVPPLPGHRPGSAVPGARAKRRVRARPDHGQDDGPIFPGAGVRMDRARMEPRAACSQPAASGAQ